MWVWTDKMRFIALVWKRTNQRLKLEERTNWTGKRNGGEIFYPALKPIRFWKDCRTRKRLRDSADCAPVKSWIAGFAPGNKRADFVGTGARNEFQWRRCWITYSYAPDFDDVGENRLNFELKNRNKGLKKCCKNKSQFFCYPSGAFDELVWQAVKQTVTNVRWRLVTALMLTLRIRFY
jgi:hypothetical protein